MRGWIRGLFAARPGEAGDPPSPRVAASDAPHDVLADAHARLALLLGALEPGRCRPPADPRSRSGWDEHWNDYLTYGAGILSLLDRLAADESLPPLLAARGARTVLCAGNGLSIEATSLALLGFDVTALDLSDVPREQLERARRSADHPLHRVPGLVFREDGSASVAGAGPIDGGFCPTMHRSAAHPNRAGGVLRFVTGDLCDAAVCPGPFDVVVERRTAQLFPEPLRSLVLERLTSRLATPGVFVSQEHHPGEPRRGGDHFASAWLRDRGFAVAPAGGDAARGELLVSAPSRTPVRLALLAFTEPPGGYYGP